MCGDESSGLHKTEGMNAITGGYRPDKEQTLWRILPYTDSVGSAVKLLPLEGDVHRGQSHKRQLSCLAKGHKL